jgi:hypothetical protein
MALDVLTFLSDVSSRGVAPAAVTVVELVLLSIGLVALYAHQSEATGILGLVGFLMAYVGTVVGLLTVALPMLIVWIALLLLTGWALFGIASLRAQVYPRAAALLLIIGALLEGVATALIRGGMIVVGPWAATTATVLPGLIYSVAIAWLGFSLFRKRPEEVHQPTHVS